MMSYAWGYAVAYSYPNGTNKYTLRYTLVCTILESKDAVQHMGLWHITFTFSVQWSRIPGPTMINWLWCATANTEAPPHAVSHFSLNVLGASMAHAFYPKLGLNTSSATCTVPTWIDEEDVVVMMMMMTTLTRVVTISLLVHRYYTST